MYIANDFQLFFVLPNFAPCTLLSKPGAQPICPRIVALKRNAQRTDVNFNDSLTQPQPVSISRNSVSSLTGQLLLWLT